jgi:cell division protein FtsQ
MRKIVRRNEDAAPRDPAPSRIAYRVERLWLTPIFRAVLRVGLPCVLAFSGAAYYLGNPDNMDRIRETLRDVRSSVEHRPEFMVHLMRIDNASDEVSEDIREVALLDFPISSFELDLHQLREQIETLDAVASADLHIQTGGVLTVKITERIPAIVWRSEEGLELLDQNGRRVSTLGSRASRSDLPLVLGVGAEREIAQALELFAAAEPLHSQLRGLIRVGERRWDLALTGNRRILLPETDPITALEQVIVLERSGDLLARNIENIDFRNAKRPTIREFGATNAMVLNVPPPPTFEDL